MLRSKAAFGEDITKRVNEPARERFNFTLPASDSALRLPAHLAAPAAIGPETAPYEEAIIDYIISTHDEQEFPGACRKKMKNVKNRRRFVVERIYKVYMAYRLRRKTLYLAVYYFDKFMRLAEEKDFEKQKLIGESCLLIAMKYEEIYPPLLSTWASGKEKQLIDLEFRILKTLDFKLAYTSPQHYLEIYQAKHATNKQEARLHELVLDLFLFTGNVYDQHPLKAVQEMLESFRPTAFMEKGTVYEESDRNIKQLI